MGEIGRRCSQCGVRRVFGQRRKCDRCRESSRKAYQSLMYPRGLKHGDALEETAGWLADRTVTQEQLQRAEARAIIVRFMLKGTL